MQHRCDRLVEDVVFPDPLPVIAQNKTVAQSDGDLAGIGNFHVAQPAQEDRRENVDMTGQEGNGGFAQLAVEEE